MDQAQIEWDAWQVVVEKLSAIGVTAADWKSSPSKAPETPGQAAIQAVMHWGEELARLRKNQE